MLYRVVLGGPQTRGKKERLQNGRTAFHNYYLVKQSTHTQQCLDSGKASGTNLVAQEPSGRV